MSIRFLSSISSDSHLHVTLIIWMRDEKLVFRTVGMFYFFFIFFPNKLKKYHRVQFSALPVCQGSVFNKKNFFFIVVKQKKTRHEYDLVLHSHFNPQKSLGIIGLCVTTPFDK